MKYPKYCGWCGKYIEECETEHSTGICPSCAQEQLQKVLLSRKEQAALAELASA